MIMLSFTFVQIENRDENKPSILRVELMRKLQVHFMQFCIVCTFSIYNFNFNFSYDFSCHVIETKLEKYIIEKTYYNII